MCIEASGDERIEIERGFITITPQLETNWGVLDCPEVAVVGMQHIHSHEYTALVSATILLRNMR